MKGSFSFQGLKELYARRSEPENLRKLSDMYWAFLVCLATLIVVGSIGYGVWEFVFSEGSTPLESSSGAGIVGFNREQLQMLVQTFEKQQSDFEQLMTR